MNNPSGAEVTNVVDSENRLYGRSVRLRGRSNFLETIKGESSRKVYGRLCQLSLASTEDNSTKFGITVSRKVGNAVRRNRLKRVIKEFLRNNRPLWPTGKMIVIYLSVPIDDEKRLMAEIGRMLKGVDE